LKQISDLPRFFAAQAPVVFAICIRQGNLQLIFTAGKSHRYYAIIFIKKLKRDLKMPHIQAIMKALPALMIYTAGRATTRRFRLLAS
jgi:hypothetical protein